MTTITKESLTRIIETADEVLSALAGTNDDVHPDDSKKMCSLWDDLNDRYAPPEVVRAMALELQEYRKAQGVPVVPDEIKRNAQTGWFVGPDGKNWSATEALAWNKCRAAMLQSGSSPVIPDGWVMVPKEPTYQMCEAMGISWENPPFPARYRAMIAAAPGQEESSTGSNI